MGLAQDRRQPLPVEGKGGAKALPGESPVQRIGEPGGVERAVRRHPFHVAVETREVHGADHTAVGQRVSVAIFVIGKGLVAAPVGGLPANATRDEARHLRSLGLLVAAVDSVVAQLGHGEGDELPGVGRVGEDLLVAGMAGVEDHFARGFPVGAAGGPLERLAAGERQRGLLHSSLLCTSLPSTYVRSTRPRSVQPAKGLLRLRDQNRWGSTFHALSGSTTMTSAGAPGASVP